MIDLELNPQEGAENIELITNVHGETRFLPQVMSGSNLDSNPMENAQRIENLIPILMPHLSNHNSRLGTPQLQFVPKITRDEDLFKIAESRNFMKLDTLTIVNRLQDSLSEFEVAEDLERVDISGCSNIDDETVRLFATAKLNNYILHFSVEHCLTVTNIGLKLITESQNFSRIEHLNIGRCDDIDDEGLKMIAGSAQMIHLKSLSIHKIYMMSNAGLIELGNSPHLIRLTKLNISKNLGIDDKGLVEFINTPLMKRLESLNINGCLSITTAGLLELIKSENASSLRSLKMKEIPVDRAIDNALSSQGSLKNLELLHLTTQIDLKKFFESGRAEGKSFEIIEEKVEEIEEKKIKKYRKFKMKKNPRKLTITGPKNVLNLKNGDFLNEVQTLIIANLKTENAFKTIFAGQDEEDKTFEIPLTARGGRKSARAMTVTDLTKKFEPSSQLSKLGILQIVNCPDIEIEALEILNTFFWIRSYANLRVIRFSNVKLDDKTLIYLSKSKIHSLEIMVLDKIKGITSNGIRNLVASPICQSLITLKFQNFPIEDNAIKYIASSTNLSNLTHLKLKNINMNKLGLAHILGSVVLTKVRELSIKGNTHLNDDCVDRIISDNPLKVDMLKLDITNRITLDGWRKLTSKKISFVEIHMKKFNYDDLFFENNPKYKDVPPEKLDIWSKSLECLTDSNINITSLTLDCSKNRIDCATIAEIVSQPQLKSVMNLTINFLLNADEIFVSLNKAKFLNKLTSIHFNLCSFDPKKKPVMIDEFFSQTNNIIKIKITECLGFNDEFVESFLNKLGKLTSIDFERLNHISNKTLESIANPKKSELIKQLRFWDCDTIDDKGMEFLITKGKQLDRVTKIDIDMCDLITHKTTVSIFKSGFFSRLTQYRFNRPVDFDKSFIDLFMENPMKNLFDVKIEFKEIQKQYMLKVLELPEGTKKNMLFKMAFNANTIPLIDDEIFAQLLHKRYLRFCSSLPSILTNTRMTSQSVLKLIMNYKDAEPDLDVKALFENWALLIDEEVLKAVADVDKLRAHLTHCDFLSFKSLQKEGIKTFIKSLAKPEELNDFMHFNMLEIDDDIFKVITDNPCFSGIKSLPFKEFQKLTVTGIKNIFTSNHSKITFSKYLEYSGLSKEQIEAEVIVAAYNSNKFDLTYFNPEEFVNLSAGYADSFFDPNYPKSIVDLHLKGEWMGQQPLTLLEKKFGLPNLKIIRFSDSPSKKCSENLLSFFRCKNFQHVEEIYLDRVTLTEDFFKKIELDSIGKVRTFSIRNVVIATVNDVNYTSFALSNVLKKVKNFTITNVRPTDDRLILQLAAGEFNFDSLEYGDVRDNGIQNFDLACKYINTEVTFKELKHLRLFKIGITDEFLKQMAASTTLQSLESLDFDQLDKLELDGFTALLQSPVIEKVTRIKLNLIMNSEWLEAISNSPYLKKAEYFVFKARNNEGKAVQLFNGMCSLLASKTLESLDVCKLFSENKEHISDKVLEALGKSNFKKNLKYLDLLQTNIKSSSLATVLVGINTDFDMKKFLLDHRSCSFIDDTIYNLVVSQNSKYDEVFFSGKFVNVKPQAKLKEFFEKKNITSTKLNIFLERYAKDFDIEGIKILIKNKKYLKGDNPDKQEISVKLTHLHENVSKEGLELLLTDLVEKFSIDYDWILHEARWRKLLTKKGLEIIADGNQKDLAYVDTLDFSDNNYLTSVGYHKMIGEYMQEFYRELGIYTGKSLRPIAMANAASSVELQKLNDLEAQEFDISETAVLEDTKDFLDNIARGRVNWDRIKEDDEVGKNFLKLIRKCNYVRVLKLDDKNIGDEIVKELSRQIWQLTIEGKCFLEVISLKNNPRITFVGMKYLYTALVGNNTVKEINVRCDDNIKLEYNNLVNNGVRYTIVEKMHEYMKIYRQKKKIRFYDKYCKYIALYTMLCMPFACYQYHEDKIKKKFKSMRQNSSCLKKLTDCWTNLTGKKKIRREKVQSKTGRKENRELFVFEVNMIRLNFWLSKKKIWLLLFINWVLYYSACILPPLLKDRSDCEATLNVFGVIFIGYAVFAFFLELWLYKNICDIVNNPEVLEFKYPVAIFNCVLSQLSKAAFYTNITFILSQYQCGSDELAIASLVFVFITFLLNLRFTLPKFITTLIFFCKGGSAKTSHTTKFINKMCKLSFHLEFLTISKTLERFATSSSIKISNQYYPQVMIGAFIKFSFGDTPQVVLKIINLIRQFNNWVDVVSPVLNAFKIFQSFNIAMEAKPSICTAQMIEEVVGNGKQRDKNLEEIESFMRDTKDTNYVNSGKRKIQPVKS